MKIETLAWKWADAVKKKEVYRDHEFIRSSTKEEAIEATKWLMSQQKGYDYTITVSHEDCFKTYWMYNMPCLGGLCKYKDTHGDKYFMNPYFPRDIRVKFPDGDPVFIAVPASLSKDSDMYRFLVSQESPWVSGFGSAEDLIAEKTFVILTNMNTDPTVFYHLVRYASLSSVLGGIGQVYTHPKAWLIANHHTVADLRRLAGQLPNRISGGTWAEGYGYTRPFNESLFHTKLPYKLEEFTKLSSVGPTLRLLFDREVNNKLLKEVGISCDNGLVSWNKEWESTLVDAWDFFKEKAKEL